MASAEDPPDFGDDDGDDAPVSKEGAATEVDLGSAADAAIASLGELSLEGFQRALPPPSAGVPPAPPPVGSMPDFIPAAAPPGQVLSPAPVGAVGPTVVMPPAASLGMGMAMAPLAPPPAPPIDEEALPMETDGDAWLELLRDGFARQLREENECEEPPPYHKAMQFAADPPNIPTGKYPRNPLNIQLQLLLRLRSGDLPIQKGAAGKGGKKGGANVQSPSAAALPHLLKQMQQVGQGVRLPATMHNQAQQSSLLMAAAKALTQTRTVPPNKGFGKGGVQRTIH